jgi:hypothetical protein
MRNSARKQPVSPGFFVEDATVDRAIWATARQLPHPSGTVAQTILRRNSLRRIALAALPELQEISSPRKKVEL